MHFSVALKLLWRDWRAGELTLLLVSLIIAVSTVTTITLFVDRLQQALLRESSTFLAADRVISSSHPIADDILIKAGELGLQQAQTLSFLSMVFSADRAQFTAVKAVDDYYPLRGKLIVSDAPFLSGCACADMALRNDVCAWDNKICPFRRFYRCVHVRLVEKKQVCANGPKDQQRNFPRRRPSSPTAQA
ncbi:MAG: hypothetical protein IIA75_11620 [Proteobacteria bacterium]|nr:hypothetical protein [Pseudomonadota bacterium]